MATNLGAHESTAACHCRTTNAVVMNIPSDCLRSLEPSSNLAVESLCAPSVIPVGQSFRILLMSAKSGHKVDLVSVVRSLEDSLDFPQLTSDGTLWLQQYAYVRSVGHAGPVRSYSRQVLQLETWSPSGQRPFSGEQQLRSRSGPLGLNGLPPDALDRPRQANLQAYFCFLGLSAIIGMPKSAICECCLQVIAEANSSTGKTSIGTSEKYKALVGFREAWRGAAGLCKVRWH